MLPQDQVLSRGQRTLQTESQAFAIETYWVSIHRNSECKNEISEAPATLAFLPWLLWDDRKYIVLLSAPSSWNPWNFLSDKNTRSIFCSNVWPLTPAPDTELLKPLAFPEWEKCLVLKRRTFLGELLDGDWSLEKQTTIRSLEFSVPPSSLLQRGEKGWKWS